MSQTVFYQTNLLNSLNIKENFYSPAFGTNHMFWQLMIELEGEDYGIYLKPVAGLDEIAWGERSKLPFKFFIKEINNNQITALHISTYMIVPTDTKIERGFGTTFKRSSLQNGELMVIGVIFNNIEYKEGGINKNYTIEPIPKNLIEAWKDQLFDFKPADVEFYVQGEKFYARSSIISKRSEYFANLLSGKWAESMIVKNKNLTMQLNNDLTDNHIKHHIEISDCDPITFSTMLEYLYTNQVKWTIDDESITMKLFCLADKYLLSDLRERAKFRILNELNIYNASEFTFSLGLKYEDLKEPLLKFMARNFAKISNSQEFKSILSNLVNYPNYDVILSEIFAQHFKN